MNKKRGENTLGSQLDPQVVTATLNEIQKALTHRLLCALALAHWKDKVKLKRCGKSSTLRPDLPYDALIGRDVGCNSRTPRVKRPAGISSRLPGRQGMGVDFYFVSLSFFGAK
jgi:hypothetical protein